MNKIRHESESGNNALIIPMFIMNSGCPHRCIFCNQKISAGNFPSKITKEYFDNEINSYLTWNKDKSRKIEIAFYGGSFTGIDSFYQEELLSWAGSYIHKGLVQSIRISTRPDCISEKQLSLLKESNVTTVEIGAESFVDQVLLSARRGHDAASIVRAVKLLKENGFRTGLHLMAGLPEDTKERFFYSVDKTMDLEPDTVRLHPVIVFKETLLAEKFVQGTYKPLDLTEAVEWCALAWRKLSQKRIRVIRMGVHVTPEMKKEGAVLAGPVHSAFGSLVLSSVFYAETVSLLASISPEAREIRFCLSKRDISNFHGMNNENIDAIKRLYPAMNLVVESRPGQPSGEIFVKADSGESFSVKIQGRD